MLEYPLFLIFPAAMALAGALDLFTMTIPNRISLALVVGFLVAMPFSGLGLAGFAANVGTAMLVLAIGFILFASGFLGGGDAKLIAAAALWFGPEHVLVFLLFTALAGGALAIGILAFRSFLLPARFAAESWIARLHARKGKIPYGIAISAGSLLAFPRTIWFFTFAV